MNSRLHALIYGFVQGVFFRIEARDMAKKLGLAGWVMNREDGSVEIIAEGDRACLEELLRWCKEGSEGSTVEGVEFKWEQYKGEFSDFSVKFQ